MCDCPYFEVRVLFPLISAGNSSAIPGQDLPCPLELPTPCLYLVMHSFVEKLLNGLN